MQRYVKADATFCCHRWMMNLNVVYQSHPMAWKCQNIIQFNLPRLFLGCLGDMEAVLSCWKYLPGTNQGM